MTQQAKLVLVGNPNSGKSTLFNALTGGNAVTGNWAGVTVDSRHGCILLDADWQVDLQDLPGLYSLDDAELSDDVRCTRDVLCQQEIDLLINVVDARYLERHFYLTAQLAELGLPMVLVVNYADLAEQQGMQLRIAALAEGLACPVLALSALHETGLEELKQQISNALTHKPSLAKQPVYDPAIEDSVAELVAKLSQQQHWPQARLPDLRRLALALLSHDRYVSAAADEKIQKTAEQAVRAIETALAEDIDILLADGRYQFATEYAELALVQSPVQINRFSDRLDHCLLHPWIGSAAFFGIMYLLFAFTMVVGGAFINFFDALAAAWIVTPLDAAASALQLPAFFHGLLVEGLGGGLQLVANFIPIIGALYLALAFLEESGYMARAAWLADGVMQRIGLPGKAFVPLLVGFGCNVPAVMATRTLEQPRERLLTILMTPFMSCGARLSVYVVFAAAFFPGEGAWVVMALYLLGLVAALFTAWLIGNTLLPGQVQPLLLELGAYRLPGVLTLLQRAWFRVRSFVMDAGKIIVIMISILYLLNSPLLSSDDGKSLIRVVSEAAAPVFEPIGVDADNWQAVVGLTTGVVAKEVVVATLDSLYQETVEVAAELSFLEQNSVALSILQDDLVAMLAGFLDPLGLSVVDEDAAALAESQAISAATFAHIAQGFQSPMAAFAYLAFVLLYFPCIAVLGAIKRETNLSWTLFSMLWSTTLAYAVAVIIYQTSLLIGGVQISSALFWLVAMLGLLLGLGIVFRLYGQRQRTYNAV